jgi:Bacteriophage head to tail connecting protein
VAEQPAEKLDDHSKDALGRLRKARAQKQLVVRDLQEAYFFIRPRLSRIVTSTNKPSKANSEDVDDLATGIGSEVSEDFATEMIAAFFPQHADWAASSAELLPEGAVEADISEDIQKYDHGVFSAIRRSNFDAELGVAFDPDAAIGTPALMITAQGAGRPYRVEHVPTRELEINLGPDGEVDDRFRVRWVKCSDLEAVLGKGIELPAKIVAKRQSRPDEAVECVWGWWRDWSDAADDRWYHVILVGGEQVHFDSGLVGAGAVPLIVMPFSPDRVHAWGNGPAMKALQDFRVLDVFTEATQDGALFSVKKPFGYPDDGVMDFEGGIEAGKAYPMRPGGGRDLVPLVFPDSQQLAFTTEEKIEHRIRRKFFADYPDQTGKTPPTATQWVDEMLRAQRRIGTPGMNFWRVGPMAIFQRFAWLCERDGLVSPVLAGKQRVPLAPQNPATQAQDQQRLQVALHLLEIAKSAFPQTSQIAIDEMGTIDNIKKLLRDKVIVFRSADEAKQLMQNMLGAAQRLGAAGGGQAPAPGGGQ